MNHLAFVFMLFFLLFIIAFKSEFLYFVYVLTLPYIVLYIAYIPKGTVRKYNLLGDYSYGMYIYAFPVQQSIVHVYREIEVNNLISMSWIATLILAVLSWYFIEKPCLKLKDVSFIKRLSVKFS